MLDSQYDFLKPEDYGWDILDEDLIPQKCLNLVPDQVYVLLVVVKTLTHLKDEQWRGVFVEKRSLNAMNIANAYSENMLKCII